MSKDRPWTTNPWDMGVEAQSQETAYCEICDITIVDADTTWYTDYAFGEAECPECGTSLDVRPPEPFVDFESLLDEWGRNP